MPLSFTCPHCGIRSDVDERFAGQTGPCRQCGQRITIPFKTPGRSSPSRHSDPSTGSSALLTICVVGLLGLLTCGGIGFFWVMRAQTAQRMAQREVQEAARQAQVAEARSVFDKRIPTRAEAKASHASPAPDRFIRAHLVPSEGGFMEQLGKHAAKARELKFKMFIEFGSLDPVCEDVDNSLSDPRMVEAYAGTYIVHLDNHEWQGQARIPQAIPAWVELDKDCTMTAHSIDGTAWAENTPMNMAPILKQFFATSDTDPVRGEEQWMFFHERDVTCLTCSPNGEWIVSGGQDKTIRMWNAKTGQPGKVLANLAEVPGSVSVRADGQQIMACYQESGSVSIWDAETGTLVAQPAPGEAVGQVGFGPGPDELVFLMADGTFNIRSLKGENQTSVANSSAVPGTPNASPNLYLAGSPDSRIWVVSRGHTLEVFSVERGLKGTHRKTGNVLPGPIAVSGNGRRAACGTFTRIEVFNISGSVVPYQMSWIDVDAGVRCLALSNDGRLLAADGPANNIVLWDTKRGVEIGRRRGHLAPLNQLAFLDDHTLASGSEDNTIRVWDLSGVVGSLEAASIEAPSEEASSEPKPAD